MAVTEDGLLGGRLRLLQPAEGYRAAIDPVLLAAAVAAPEGGHVLDLGCGTGAALLCLASRRPDLTLTGIDADESALDLARRSAALNGMAARCAFERRAVEDGLPRQSFDAVLTNPPYLAEGRGTAPAASRRDAHMEGGADLACWLDEAMRSLRPKGSLHVVHRADRLPEILALIAPRLGAIEILPLWPKAGAEARRVIVSARRDRKSPARLLPGLVLHEADGRFTAEAEAILRDGLALA